MRKTKTKTKNKKQKINKNLGMQMVVVNVMKGPIILVVNHVLLVNFYNLNKFCKSHDDENSYSQLALCRMTNISYGYISE